MPSFTAHNIRMPDGTFTMPGTSVLVADDARMVAVRRILHLVYPNGPSGRSVVDLGCLEGGYTLEFAKLGMHACGIEIREANFQNCTAVARAYPELPLNFEKDDVWNIARYGRFDVAFCSGILYHLERPKAYLDLLASQTNDLLIINTHVALQSSTSEMASLSPLSVHEGLLGRWYSEYDPKTITPGELEDAKWTAWTNSQSFWPTKPALMQVLYDVGFDLVFEQADWLAPAISAAMADTMYSQLGRCHIVGVRTARRNWRSHDAN